MVFTTHIFLFYFLPLFLLVYFSLPSRFRNLWIALPAMPSKKRLVIWEFVERDIRLGTEGWQVLRLPTAAQTAFSSAGNSDNPARR